ncbi:MAG: hypothetical protein H6849_01925 [Alphaproteobacteria bacterium]|nr:MAG: hypothetical protein H6849_01925 [Alphaproteobacteria bacterium]
MKSLIISPVTNTKSMHVFKGEEKHLKNHRELTHEGLLLRAHKSLSMGFWRSCRVPMIAYFLSANIHAGSLGNYCIDGFYVKSIVYESPLQWTVIINGSTYIPTRKRQGSLSLLRVSSDAIVISIDGAHVPLKAHESYDCVRKKVISGKCMFQPIKKHPGPA